MDADFWLGAMVGALFGVPATVFLQPTVERLKNRVASRLHLTLPKTSGGEDLREIDLYQIMSWSPSRPLDPDRHRVERDYSERSPQQWFPQDTLDAKVALFRSRVQGEVCEVSDSTVDHGESGEEDAKGFTLRVRPSLYADSLAIPTLLSEIEHWRPVEQRIHRQGILAALSVAPARSFFVNLTVTTKRGEVLVTRRSAATASASGLQCVGVCETMNALPRIAGHRPEDLFDLARRAAWEELGLRPDHLGPIWFTWYGFGRHHGQFAVAHCQTHLTTGEVQDRMRNAEANWEADAYRWIALNSSEFGDLEKLQDHPGWLPLTPVVVRGLRTVWPSLPSTPRRP